MPTIIREDSFRLFFYSNENNEPVHVHIQKGSAVAKFWVKPVKLASNMGMKGSELSKAGALVRKYEIMIEEKWHEYFKQ